MGEGRGGGEESSDTRLHANFWKGRGKEDCGLSGILQSVCGGWRSRKGGGRDREENVQIPGCTQNFGREG